MPKNENKTKQNKKDISTAIHVMCWIKFLLFLILMSPHIYQYLFSLIFSLSMFFSFIMIFHYHYLFFALIVATIYKLKVIQWYNWIGYLHTLQVSNKWFYFKLWNNKNYWQKHRHISKSIIAVIKVIFFPLWKEMLQFVSFFSFCILIFLNYLSENIWLRCCVFSHSHSYFSLFQFQEPSTYVFVFG